MRWTPFALGFRPFFFVGTLAAVVVMAVWLAVWRGVVVPPHPFTAVTWHAHEMLFGYVAAIVAGFLLTAVRNWTGVDTWTGGRLAILVGVWLLGRILPWVPGSPPMVNALVDAAFLLLVAFSLIKPLFNGPSKVNRIFLLMLVAMATANLVAHLQMQHLVTAGGDMQRVMLDLVLLLVVVVAGRVLPFFTQGAIPGFKAVSRKWVEAASIVLILLIAVIDATGAAPAWVAGSAWLAFAAVQAMRLSGWIDLRVVKIPVLWVLHAGYLWITLGALLTGIARFGGFFESAALHALTVGGIGIFTLGMMARVARGHTGRPINVTRRIAAMFVVLNVVTVVRVFGPAWLPAQYALWVDISGALWLLAFGVFAIEYASILLRPRVDGRPG